MAALVALQRAADAAAADAVAEAEATAEADASAEGDATAGAIVDAAAGDAILEGAEETAGATVGTHPGFTVGTPAGVVVDTPASATVGSPAVAEADVAMAMPEAALTLRTADALTLGTADAHGTALFSAAAGAGADAGAAASAAAAAAGPPPSEARCRRARELSYYRRWLLQTYAPRLAAAVVWGPSGPDLELPSASAPWAEAATPRLSTVDAARVLWAAAKLRLRPPRRWLSEVLAGLACRVDGRRLLDVASPQVRIGTRPDVERCHFPRLPTFPHLFSETG
eukprot:130023-Chlamydomonas_euryale.AAC.1